MNYISEIVVFLTGITSGLFAHRQFNKTQKKSEMETVVEVYKALHKEIKDSDEKCKTELKSISDELAYLKGQVMILQSASNDLPFPQWLKDMELRMVWVNKEYEKAFLIPRGKKSVDYIGKKDEEIWGIEEAKEYTQNDYMVLHSKTGYWFGEEHIQIKEINLSSHWKIVKYVKYSGNIPTNIGGMAIPV